MKLSSLIIFLRLQNIVYIFATTLYLSWLTRILKKFGYTFLEGYRKCHTESLNTISIRVKQQNKTEVNNDMENQIAKSSNPQKEKWKISVKSNKWVPLTAWVRRSSDDSASVSVLLNCAFFARPCPFEPEAISTLVGLTQRWHSDMVLVIYYLQRLIDNTNSVL